MHLPLVPPQQDNLLGQLLVDPNTANGLCWSLLSEVDPNSGIGGKSLLEVFCQHRRGDRQVWTDGNFQTDPLPASTDQPWPDPRQRANADISKGWPTSEMWVAAHLICNGPDPFSWRLDQPDRDVLDVMIRWKNPLLLDQLLRLPSAPSVQSLSKRKFPGKEVSWLHGLAADGQYKMIEVLLHHGMDPLVCTSSGASLLHHAANDKTVEVLLEAGCDPFATDKLGKSAPQAWVSHAFSPQSTAQFPERDLSARLKILGEFTSSIDPDRAIKQEAPALFDATLRGKGVRFIVDASKIHGVPLENWRLQDGSSSKSLLGAMAIEALRKKKSSLVPQMVLMAEGMPVEALFNVSRRNTTDLAFCWMAINQYDATPASTRLLERFCGKLWQDRDRAQAQVLVWQSAFLLDGVKPFEGTKIDTGIRAAWTREIAAIHREFGLYDVPSSPKVPFHRVDAIMANPGLLVDLARMPNSSGLTALEFIDILEKIEERNPDLIQTCLLAAVAMAQNPDRDKNQLERVGSAIKGYLARGVSWDQTLPGADRALHALAELAPLESSLAPLLSQLQAQQLGRATPASPASARPRF